MEFKVFLGGKIGRHYGTLALGEDGIIWTSSKTTKKDTIKKENIRKIQWTKTSIGNRIQINDRSKKAWYTYIGLKDHEYDGLYKFCEEKFEKKIEKEQICLSGTNWGDIDINDNLLRFYGVDGKEKLNLEMVDIKSCTANSKSQELSLEFHGDESAKQNDDTLVQLRFHLPKDSKDSLESRLNTLHKTILKKADILSDSGEEIVTFSKLPFAAPRGRYNVGMYAKFMRLYGGTFVFKILYRSVTTMFILSKPHSTQMYFVVLLDNPVRLTRKPLYYLVMLFDKNNIMKTKNPIRLNMSQKQINQKYPKKGLTTKMKGPLYEIVARVFRGLSNKKVVGSGSFTGYNGESNGIKCSVKASEGLLYLLEKSVMFLHSPTVYFRHVEISSIKFQRAQRGLRYFDIVIFLRGKAKHQFSNIQKNEYDNLVSFIKKKNIRIENLVQEETKRVLNTDLLGSDDDDSDEDFNLNGEESEDENLEEDSEPQKKKRKSN